MKGPQGTLFGRNSIAGAVSVITNKPENAFEASAELTLADYDHIEDGCHGQRAAGRTMAALRVAGYALDNKGFLENLAGGEDLGFHQVSAGRAALRRSARCSTRR